MSPGRSSLNVLMSKLGNPGHVGFNGRPMKNCHQHFVQWESIDTYIVEKDSGVTTQSEEFARVKRVDVDEYSLESSIDQCGRGERKPVVVCVGV
jgi:hypothetical protein